jgi:uncharacterized membrane protein YcaP (DUF421 family)
MKARISEEEFKSYLRLSGTNDISDIKLSYLEINGQVSLSKQRKKTEKNSATTTIIGCCLYIIVVDAILKSIIKRQIPFLIGGTITGTIMAYYYGFLFTIIVNSLMWYVISYLVSKYYYKSKGINDQKYLIQYGLSKIKSRNKRANTT